MIYSVNSDFIRSADYHDFGLPHKLLYSSLEQRAAFFLVSLSSFFQMVLLMALPSSAVLKSCTKLDYLFLSLLKWFATLLFLVWYRFLRVSSRCYDFSYLIYSMSKIITSFFTSKAFYLYLKKDLAFLASCRYAVVSFD